MPAGDRDNLQRLAEALQDLDAEMLETDDLRSSELSADPTSVDDLMQGGNFCLTTKLGRLDLMQWIAGIDAEDLYSTLLSEALAGELDGVPLRVCSLAHLLAMKRGGPDARSRGHKTLGRRAAP